MPCYSRAMKQTRQDVLVTLYGELSDYLSDIGCLKDVTPDDIAEVQIKILGVVETCGKAWKDYVGAVPPLRFVVYAADGSGSSWDVARFDDLATALAVRNRVHSIRPDRYHGVYEDGQEERGDCAEG